MIGAVSSGESPRAPAGGWSRSVGVSGGVDELEPASYEETRVD